MSYVHPRRGVDGSALAALIVYPRSYDVPAKAREPYISLRWDNPEFYIPRPFIRSLGASKAPITAQELLDNVGDSDMGERQALGAPFKI
jgi:hypothetical protein